MFFRCTQKFNLSTCFARRQGVRRGAIFPKIARVDTPPSECYTAPSGKKAVDTMDHVRRSANRITLAGMSLILAALPAYADKEYNSLKKEDEP